MDNQKLKEYFNFDEEDLLANRAGDFSEKQKNDILKDIKRFEKGIFGLGTKSDLTEHSVRKADGPINIVRQEYAGEHRPSNFNIYLHIGGKQFSVDEDIADVMMQGDVYVVYYDYMGSMKKGVKRSIKGERDSYEVYYDDSEGIILSAELISKAK